MQHYRTWAVTHQYITGRVNRSGCECTVMTDTALQNLSCDTPLHYRESEQKWHECTVMTDAALQNLSCDTPVHYRGVNRSDCDSVSVLCTVVADATSWVVTHQYTKRVSTEVSVLVMADIWCNMSCETPVHTESTQVTVSTLWWLKQHDTIKSQCGPPVHTESTQVSEYTVMTKANTVTMWTTSIQKDSQQFWPTMTESILKLTADAIRHTVAHQYTVWNYCGTPIQSVSTVAHQYSL